MALESKTIFFSLASFLVFIIILSVLGVLGPVPSSKEKEVVVTTNRGLFYPPSYYGGPYRKNFVYAPDMYVAPGPYARRYANRRFRRYW